LVSIILLFLGYRIFRRYKELCNADEGLSDVTCVIFVLNSFDVSRLLDISRVQRALAMPLNAFLTETRIVFVLHSFNVLGYRIFRGYKELCNAAERLSDCDPRRLLFLTFLLFLGYRIFRGYKELCNAAERLPDVTHFVFVLNYFNVSRLPDISGVQRALAMPLNVFLTVTRVVFVPHSFNVSRLPYIPWVQRAVQCR
jgi:hypothetical protein